MITIDNYEEFFLLYIDNELPIADRLMVEHFVADHPDLREEWETLLQCRIQPEPSLSFPARDTLMRQEPDFLSYIDEELDEKDRASLEEFIRHHPQSFLELEGWRQTISYPDPAIVFPDKKSLYRREGAPWILFSPWVRVGAAAAIAGIVALLVLLPGSTRKGTRSAVTDSDGRSLATGKPPLPDTVAAAPSQPSAVINKIAVAVTPAAPATFYTTGNGKQAAGGGRPKKSIRVTEDSPAPQQDGKPGNDAAAFTTELAKSGGIEPHHPIAVILPEQIRPGDKQEIRANDPMVAQAGSDPKQEVGIPREQSSFATQALQNETNDPENKLFVSDEPAAPAKLKLRGMFRKVTRAFGKTADRDKDGQRQVLIGAFQFALK
jgi:anti-sigma factor RsiW